MVYSIIIRTPLFIGLWAVVWAAFGYKDPLAVIANLKSLLMHFGFDAASATTVLLIWIVGSLFLTIFQLASR